MISNTFIYHIVPLISCGGSQNTNTKSHITILTHFLCSSFYSSCGIDTAVQSGGSNWPMDTEVYRKPSSHDIPTPSILRRVEPLHRRVALYLW
jgi:hypothetical protein